MPITGTITKLTGPFRVPPVTCVPGSELAMKITRPLDLVLAEALLRIP